MKNFKILIIIMLAFLGINKAKAQTEDWANLKHFQKENEAIKIPLENEDRVVFMGNSITIGWLHKRPDFFKGKPYINRGISGQTTPQMLIRFRQDVVELHPKVVVLLAGTNDIAGNTGSSTLNMIINNIKGMAEIAKANNIKVILSSTLPAYKYPWSPEIKPADKIVALNKMIKEYAFENDCIYLDYFSAMVDDRNGLPKKYAKDEVHPTAEGYAVMEPLVEEAIKEALKK
ncbi:SGNH/GDSL hydrolase family protein [uncultured Maribacter sp.]|uniref:SGNH/GDSL hydrolase family protein n=1 Tax=uncultured Maribacter sp. TaxID=431308 RepID=UPI002620B27A|nr:SGNH/GDSL hydrolase family protein [uncultured Maribacter sp.]